MQADRVIAPQLLQHMRIPAAGIEIVFGVDFEPVHFRPVFEKLAVMRSTQADADGRARVRFDAPMRLWSPARPKPYRVEVSTPGDTLIEEIGFGPVDTGTLAGSSRQEPGSPIYNRPMPAAAPATTPRRSP